MQGKKVTQMPLFVEGDLSKFVPLGHLLRKVEKALDLSFIFKMTAHLYCKNNGRPSIDPVVFFKMQIIAYLYGIRSDRQLCEDIQYNLAYRWYLGYPLDEATPDHSTLTRARDRFGEATFQKIFERVINECKKVGLVKGIQIVSDATLVKANASTKSMVSRDDVNSNMSKKKNESASTIQQKSTNKTHISKTDPDSSCVSRSGYGGKLYHKVHTSIDGGSRVITDCYVTTGGAHECNILRGRIDHQKKRLKLPIQEVLADSGYGHGPTYQHFKNRGIKTYIPLRDEKLGRGKNGPNKHFIFDRKNNRYKCPMGHWMLPHKPTIGTTRYRITEGKCLNCPIRTKCFPDPEAQHSRYVNRSHFQDEFDAVRRRMKSKLFKRRMRQRSWKVEGIFAEAKTFHGLARARYRGRSKMQIQAYIVATVQNLKRLMTKKGLDSSFFTNIKQRMSFLERNFVILVRRIKNLALTTKNRESYISNEGIFINGNLYQQAQWFKI